MSTVKYGYVCKRTTQGKRGFRNWWLIKDDQKIHMNYIYFPNDYFGKKIRLKIEMVEENDNTN